MPNNFVLCLYNHKFTSYPSLFIHSNDWEFYYLKLDNRSKDLLSLITYFFTFCYRFNMFPKTIDPILTCF